MSTDDILCCASGAFQLVNTRIQLEVNDAINRGVSVISVNSNNKIIVKKLSMNAVNKSFTFTYSGLFASPFIF